MSRIVMVKLFMTLKFVLTAEEHLAEGQWLEEQTNIKIHM
jgi:hypothetical protein